MLTNSNNIILVRTCTPICTSPKPSPHILTIHIVCHYLGITNVVSISHDPYLPSMQVCALECTPYAGRNKVNIAANALLCLLSFLNATSCSVLQCCATSVSILSTAALPCHLDDHTPTRRRRSAHAANDPCPHQDLLRHPTSASLLITGCEVLRPLIQGQRRAPQKFTKSTTL
jgi:hypothetical protein